MTRGSSYVAWDDANGVHMASGDGASFEQVETQDTAGGAMPSIAPTADGARVYLSWYDPDGQDLLLGIYGDVGELSLANPSPIPPPEPGAVDSGGECGEDGEPILEIASSGTSFTSNCLVAPEGEEFTITYDNPDPILHNIAVYTEQGGDPIDGTPQETGPVVQELPLEPLDAAEYFFQCDVHPTTMLGTLAVVGGARWRERRRSRRRRRWRSRRRRGNRNRSRHRRRTHGGDLPVRGGGGLIAARTDRLAPVHGTFRRRV